MYFYCSDCSFSTWNAQEADDHETENPRHIMFAEEVEEDEEI